MSEESPLLPPNPSGVIFEGKDIYDRFSASKRRAILAVVSFCGLLPLFVGGSFTPSIPQVARDLNSDGPTISLAVSLSICAASLGGLAGGAYSTLCKDHLYTDGRRPVYLYCLPLSCIGSAGVAMADSVPRLMFWRFLQAFGAAPGSSVGAGVIGDIFRLEERGQAMGIFFAAIILGPALAPPIGGVMAHYASWRSMQAALGIAAFVAFVLMFLWFPETIHPGTRQMDKIRREVAEGRIRFNWTHYFVNPLRPLALLKNPSLFAISLVGFTVLLTDFVLFIPIAYTFGVHYNITNEALIGACFLPSGIGSIIGAPLAGRISDKILVRLREQRGGVWYPEDRLRVTVFAAAILVPVTVLGSGLLTQFMGGALSLTLNLICLFFNGAGIDTVLGPSAAYVVDIMPSRSAEAMAAANGFRAMLLAAAISGIIPLIDMIGVAAASFLVAVVAWLGSGLLWCMIRYGSQMRAWGGASDI
ncbi:MFS general substrate transporter [Infundibulicybe gibba]|nr:MFS general substrate transporter [Infundibulicybe gibba]